MRANTFAPGDAQVPSHVPVPDSCNPLQHFHAVTDAPIKRAVFETRSAKEQARDLGARIIRHVKGQPIWRQLNSTARQLLYSMCYEHCEAQDGSSLIVHATAKEIALAEGFTEKSAYRPLQSLVSAAVIEPFGGWGNKAQGYQLFLRCAAGEPSHEEEEVTHSNREAAQAARAVSDSAAQTARAVGDSSLTSDTAPGRNPLTERELARAVGDSSLTSDATKISNPRFQAGNAGASLTARAPSPISTTTKNAVVGTGENTERESVFEMLHEFGIAADTAAELSQLPWVNYPLALAARLEAQLVVKKKPNYNGQGLAITFLRQPSKISKSSLAAAEREVQKAAGLGQPEKPIADVLAEQAVRQQALAAIVAMSDEAIGQLHQQLIEEAPNDVARQVYARSNPRTSPVLRSIVESRIREQIAGCPV